MSKPTLIHYAQTRHEYASQHGRDPSTLSHAYYVLCRNGSAYAEHTRGKDKVTCPACLDIMGARHGTV
jgi:hypothetical protein